MNTTEKINNFTNDVLEAMTEAIKDKDLDKVNILNYLVSQAQLLTRHLKEIEAKLIYLIKEFNNLDNSKVKKELPLQNIKIDSSQTSTIELTQKAAARANAKIKRDEFLNKLRQEGTTLKQHRGVIYKNPKSGGLVGITYSSNNGNSWFLGLPDYQYDVVVLLCENKNTDAIIIPKEFYSQLSPKMSRSRGYVKFNLHNSLGKYYLYTKKGNEPIDEFVNNFNAFK